MWGHKIPVNAQTQSGHKPVVSCTIYDRYYEKPLIVGYFEGRTGMSSKVALKLAHHRCAKLNEQGWPDED
jgi:hypothetical protein